MIKKLKPYIKGYWLPTILTPFMMMGEVAMEIYIPFLMSKMIDVGIANSDMDYVVKTGLWMVACSFISLGFGTLGSRFSSTACTGFASNLRSALFAKVQSFSFSNVDKFSTGSLITRITTDVQQLQDAFREMIQMMFRSPVMIVAATIMAFTINRKLSLVFLVALPFLVLTAVFILKKAGPLFKVMMEKMDRLNTVIEENITASRVVKAFVRQDEEYDKLAVAAGDIKKTQLRAQDMAMIASPVMSGVIYATTLAICYFGGLLMIKGEMLTGEFFTFIQYIRQILMGVIMVAMVFISFTMASASAGRIIEVLEEVPDISDADADSALKVENGAVEFKNVNFAYKNGTGDYVLSDINFSVKSGETVGIIGATGSAKSTLVQLISRLYDVSSGEVLVGGHNVKEYKLKTLRDACAMVLQKNLLFSGTIRDNLKWGKADATDEEITDACKAACADDFVRSFPEGYDTEMGQGGVNVSGGQKQRLCIARALLKSPKVLILDDSTSAVDTATDAAIRSALREKRADVTTFIIAQRISSVSDADKIIVLDNGRINGFGTPAEMLATNEIYRDVYESQTKGAVENG